MYVCAQVDTRSSTHSRERTHEVSRKKLIENNKQSIRTSILDEASVTQWRNVVGTLLCISKRIAQLVHRRIILRLDRSELSRVPVNAYEAMFQKT